MPTTKLKCIGIDLIIFLMLKFACHFHLASFSSHWPTAKCEYTGLLPMCVSMSVTYAYSIC